MTTVDGTPRRRRRSPLVLAIVIVLIAVALVVAEVVARQQADAALAKAERSLPTGVSAQLDTAPVLWQLATGGIDLRVSASESALTTWAAARSGLPDLTVSTSSGQAVLATPVTALGISVPLTATLDATVDSGQLVLTPSSITLGGLAVDAAKARSTLQSIGGGAASIASGLRYPTDGSFRVTAVQLDASGAALGVQVPLSTILSGSLPVG